MGGKLLTRQKGCLEVNRIVIIRRWRVEKTVDRGEKEVGGL
jgi:hypothetical protein